MRDDGCKCIIRIFGVFMRKIFCDNACFIVLDISLMIVFCFKYPFGAYNHFFFVDCCVYLGEFISSCEALNQFYFVFPRDHSFRMLLSKLLLQLLDYFKLLPTNMSCLVRLRSYLFYQIFSVQMLCVWTGIHFEYRQFLSRDTFPLHVSV